MLIQLDGRRVGQAIRAKALTAPGISELVTVRDVPMVSTGIDYPTSTGLITFTEKHLADLVASQDDPAIHSPRTKIGHSDPRFNARVTPDGDVLDGEPSLGSWMNLRLGDNNQTVYGDIVGVPRWFAAIVSTAYPSRSIEGNFDVQTVTGHKWSLVVDAVAMLGVIGPGVTTLDDLPALFSEEGPEGVQVIESKEGEPMSVVRSKRGRSVVRAETTPEAEIPGYTMGTETENCSLCSHYDDGTCTLYSVEVGGAMVCPKFESTDVQSSVPVTATGAVNAQVNLDDVRRGYYDQLENSQMWWWIRAIYFDPNELIVDDDEGGLYRIGFTTSGDEVEFDDPVAVKIQYIDQPATKASAALRASMAASIVNHQAAAMYTVRAESRPGGCMTPEEAAALRERLGLTPEQLPDDADDATVARVVIQASSASPPAPAQEPEAAGETAAPEGNGARPPATAITSTEEAGRIPQSAPIQLPEGTIVVDKATWDEVAGQAREGAALAAKSRDTERDSFILAAIKAGKFPPSRREHYLNAWKADPEGTRGLIDSLAPGLVPVEARGTAGTGKDETVEGAAAATAYDQNWLTAAERHRITSAGPVQAGSVPTPMIVQGGD